MPKFNVRSLRRKAYWPDASNSLPMSLLRKPPVGGLTFADPDPLTLSANAANAILISSIARLSNGTIQLGLQGTTSGNVRVQSSPVARPTDWNTLATLPALAGSAVFTDTTATNSVVRFYRLVSP